MLDYSKAKTIIDSIINTTDFSKAEYKSKNSIDFTKFDLSEIPVADFSVVEKNIHDVESSLVFYSAGVQGSRMGSDKKEFCLKALSALKRYIAEFKENELLGDVDSIRYDKARYIKDCLVSFEQKAPTSCKGNVIIQRSSLEHELKKIYSTVGDRSYVLGNLSECLIKKSKEYQLAKQCEIVDAEGISLTAIENATSDSYVSAVIKRAVERFGKGAGDLVRAVYYAKRFNRDIPELDWVFDDKVENIVRFAQFLELKGFAFKGSSTSALSNLNIITKMGLSFRIEERHDYRDYMDESIVYPVAVISL